MVVVAIVVAGGACAVVVDVGVEAGAVDPAVVRVVALLVVLLGPGAVASGWQEQLEGKIRKKSLCRSPEPNLQRAAVSVRAPHLLRVVSAVAWADRGAAGGRRDRGKE